jgi:hypothetical protein
LFANVSVILSSSRSLNISIDFFATPFVMKMVFSESFFEISSKLNFLVGTFAFLAGMFGRKGTLN